MPIIRLERTKFTGKERDTESGLDYFGARYYGSNVGRFMSPDWSATAEPVPYAKLDDPQTLNLYAYVRNNPLNKVDVDGHTAEDVRWMAEFGASKYTGDMVNDGAEQVKQVAQNNSAQQQSAKSLSAQVPATVKSAILESIIDSNSPTLATDSPTYDATGGFHEEGGIAGTNANGGVVVSPAIPGAYSPSGVVSTNLMPVDPSLNASMSAVTVSWHVHPNGRTAAGNLAWKQPPSGDDQQVAAGEHQAVPGLIHIVVGAGNNQVYFYNGSSNVQSMSLKNFMKP